MHLYQLNDGSQVSVWSQESEKFAIILETGHSSARNLSDITLTENWVVYQFILSLHCFIFPAIDFLNHELPFYWMLLSIPVNGLLLVYLFCVCVFISTQKKDKQASIHTLHLCFPDMFSCKKWGNILYTKYLQECRNGDTETLYLCDAFSKSHVKTHI